MELHAVMYAILIKQYIFSPPRFLPRLYILQLPYS